MVTEATGETQQEAADSKLHDYELMLILSPQMAEEELEARTGKIGQFLTERGGVVSATDRWGKRKLAYPIKHFAEGYYVLMKIRVEPTLCKQLEASLRISEDVLRHLLTKPES
jgi:small subunit ribosomal protein S6